MHFIYYWNKIEKPESRYQRGKIYKIISNQTNDVYYGSTIEPYLTNRLSGHRKCYKCWLNGKHNYITSYELVKFDDAKIILVEDFPCETKDQLHSREQYHIDNNECVNKNKSFCGLSKLEYNKQYREENKEKMLECNKQYREENKEKLLEYQKQCREENKEKLSELQNQYHKINKEKILESQKQYYEKNKDKINKHVDCVCGGKYIHTHKARHERSTRHQQFISNQTIDK